MKYARQITSDNNIFILSAKHYLLNLDDEIKWYDKCLKNMKAKEKILWAENVKNKLQEISDFKKDKYIILAGKDYYKNLHPCEIMKNFEIPMKGLRQGPRLHWLDEHTNGVK